MLCKMVPGKFVIRDLYLFFQKREVKKEEEEKKKDFILNQRVKAINRIKDFKIVRKFI